MVWPALWRVFLYAGGGFPREAMKRGRRSIRGTIIGGICDFNRKGSDGLVA